MPSAIKKYSYPFDYERGLTSGATNAQANDSDRLAAKFLKLALCRIVLEDVRDRGDNHPAISAALDALNIEENAAGVTRLGKQFTQTQTQLITHRLESSADERTPLTQQTS